MTNKRTAAKKEDIIYLFGSLVIIPIVILSSVFITHDLKFINNIILGTLASLGLVAIQYFIICPIQFKRVNAIFFLLTEFPCIVLYGLILLFLFEKGYLVYPDYTYGSQLAIEVKISYFIIIGALFFYGAHTVFLYLNTYQISSDKLNHLTNGYSKEINELRLQSNPYALYNYLINTGKILQKNDLERALIYTTSLTGVLNQQLIHSHAEYITLEEELQWLRSYMNTEQIVSERPFSYDIHLENEDLLMQNIPPLLFQPIIENYIQTEHNVENTIKITISIKNIPDATCNGIIVSVSDKNYNHKNESNLIKSASLLNLERRINLINNLQQFNINTRQVINNDGAQYIITIKEL